MTAASAQTDRFVHERLPPRQQWPELRYELPEAIPMGWVLYNQNGAPVRVSDYRRQNAGAHHQTLDFTGLPPGDYNLRMTVGTVTTREQLQLRKQRPADAPAPAGE